MTRHVDKSPDYVQGFEDGKRAGRLEARVRLDITVNGEKVSDNSHLVVGQCPSCHAINRHEPNCERSKL